ncbi:hypothetical protein SBADM41S_09609 [Streptomyces badius]
MDSEDDSWLLPAAKPWWPEAQAVARVHVEAAQEGYAQLVRLGLAVSRIRCLIIVPQAESAAQAWSYWAMIAAA